MNARARGGPRRAHPGSPRQQRFLEALAGCSDVAEAAAAAGVTEMAAYRWRRDQPAIRAAWDQALAEACARIEAALLARAEAQLALPGDRGNAVGDLAKVIPLLKHCRATLEPPCDEAASQDVAIEELAAGLVARLQAIVATRDAAE